jgi:hypothetical protein
MAEFQKKNASKNSAKFFLNSRKLKTNMKYANHGYECKLKIHSRLVASTVLHVLVVIEWFFLLLEKK